MEHAYVHGVGLAAPGLIDWDQSQAVLRGERAYRAEPLPAFRTSLLPRNESRRAGGGVRLAFRVAEQACDVREAAGFASVFASAAGDVDIADWLCAEVNTPARAVSPTRFHNSVHNAAAGYWSIATGSREPSTSLSGGADTFAVGLREAWSMLAVAPAPVLLVCFDVNGSGPLHAARTPIHDSFALAMLLSREAGGAQARISRPEITARGPTTFTDPGLERFRLANPAARGLPLLVALADPGRSPVVLASGQGNLTVAVDAYR